MTIFDIEAATVLPTPKYPVDAAHRLLMTDWAGLPDEEAPPQSANQLCRVDSLVIARVNAMEHYGRSPVTGWAKLPLHAEDAGPLVVGLAARTAEPLALALAAAAVTGHAVLETEEQVRAICGLDDGSPITVTEAAAHVVAERWRAPHLDGDELVFFVATDSRGERNEILEARVNLVAPWMELERIGDGWYLAPLPPPPNFMPDVPLGNPAVDPPPERTWNPVADPRARRPDPGGTSAPEPARSPGLLERLRGLFGSDED